MKKIILLLTVLIAFSAFSSFAQKDIPDPMEPPRLVNDYAGFLGNNEVQALESKLRTFNNQTSTQIYVVIVKTLSGYDKSDYAGRLGENWGIGQKGKDNGIVILVKPKTADSKGEVFIATGYGLEGAVTDAAARRIVDNEIIPSFKTGSYYNGLDKAVNRLISITRGEYTSNQYIASRPAQKRTKGRGLFGIIPFIILFLLLGRSRGSRHSSVGRSLPFWLLLGMMGSGHGRGGGFGDFSSGSGGFGGFGGGGGGSFGGGGAGGSW